MRTNDYEGLIRYGYEPVIVRGKAPVAAQWQHGQITIERLRSELDANPDAANIGLRTGTLVGVDIDVYNQDHVARLVQLCVETLGDTPLKRLGAKGLMLAYRNESPLRKITVSGSGAKVEILGLGQQFVAYGIHPDTGKEYRWIEPDPDGLGSNEPLSVPFSRLPVVTPEQLSRFADEVAKLFPGLGYGPARLTRSKDSRNAASVHSGMLVSESLVRDALSYIDPDEPRDQWRNVVASIRATNVPGDNDLKIGERLALEWSRGEYDRQGRYRERLPSRYTCDDDVLAVFHTMGPRENGITGATLFARARDAGRNRSTTACSRLSSDLVSDPPKSPRSTTLSVHLAENVTPARIDWLWPDRFARGKVGIIAGFPDAGKSQIACYIAAVVTTGGGWPYNEGTARQGAVVMLSAEDDKADTVVPRLKAAGAELSQVILVDPIIRFEGGARVINIQDDLAAIAELIEQQRAQGRDVSTIIIDPISAYLGGKAKGDSWKNTEVRALLTPLTDWAANKHVAVICISHFNKGGANGRALYRVTDSLAFTAAARTVWLTTDENGENGQPSGRKLFLKGKSNIGRDPGGLIYKIEPVRIDGDITAPRVVWQGVSALSADEALNDNKSSTSALDDATEWLRVTLAEGPVAATEVYALAEGQHASRTVSRAKRQLRVFSYRKGGFGGKGEWYWALPGTRSDRK